MGGDADEGYGKVVDAFRHNLSSGKEIGAAVAVCRDGRKVVDLWDGCRNGKTQAPWEQDTIVNVFSTTKGLTATCAHRLVDQGKLDIDAPVARYWPEFAQAGKENLPVRYLLSHRAGLPAVNGFISAEEGYRWEPL
ncbi:MAG: serine hydrolase domain-containing protein, partial [Mycobacterium sp.]